MDTPHVPHGWDAGLLLRSRPGRCCAATCSPLGDDHATTDRDIVTAAIEPTARWGSRSATPARRPHGRLAALEPTTLGLMHGPAFTGGGASALRELAAHYEPTAG